MKLPLNRKKKEKRLKSISKQLKIITYLNFRLNAKKPPIAHSNSFNHRKIKLGKFGELPNIFETIIKSNLWILENVKVKMEERKVKGHHKSYLDVPSPAKKKRRNLSSRGKSKRRSSIVAESPWLVKENKPVMKGAYGIGQTPNKRESYEIKIMSLNKSIDNDQ